jgi:tryptophan-rich sensory protein
LVVAVQSYRLSSRQRSERWFPKAGRPQLMPPDCACATALVAIVAIVNNTSAWTMSTSGSTTLTRVLGRVETKLDTIEHMLASYALDVARIKEKLGIA